MFNFSTAQAHVSADCVKKCLAFAVPAPLMFLESSCLQLAREQKLVVAWRGGLGLNQTAGHV